MAVHLLLLLLTAACPDLTHANWEVWWTYEGISGTNSIYSTFSSQDCQH
jgi:hypothetical protein